MVGTAANCRLELIQQLDDTPSIFTEFLAANGPRVSAVGLLDNRFRGNHARSREGGLDRWCGRVARGFGVRFAFVESPDALAAVIEISELAEATEANAAYMRDAAASWDGSDPIRVLSG